MLANLDRLIQVVHRQRVHCETLSFRSFLEEDQNTIGQASVRVRRTGIGRPRLDIPQELLQALHVQVGFSWAQIARDLGISESMLRRRWHLFEIPNSRIFLT